MAHLELSKKFDLDTFIQGAKTGTTTTTTGTVRVAMRKSHSVVFIIIAGATVGATITVQAIQANASTGGTTKAISGKTAKVIAANTVKILEIEASELDVANGYDYVTIQNKYSGAAAKIAGVACVRGPNRYDPSAYI